jgi:hypothetical protein
MFAGDCQYLKCRTFEQRGYVGTDLPGHGTNYKGN